METRRIRFISTSQESSYDYETIASINRELDYYTIEYDDPSDISSHITYKVYKDKVLIKRTGNVKMFLSLIHDTKTILRYTNNDFNLKVDCYTKTIQITNNRFLAIYLLSDNEDIHKIELEII
jgi:uncharacterized beta-barrel protein YwiB (DUF1934 family)